MEFLQITIKKTAWAAALSIAAFFTACSNAEHYYDSLQATPEVLADYSLVYETGDTMTLKGRLNPDKNLVITVGGVHADYTVKSHLHANSKRVGVLDSMDVVNFPITEAMGTGSRPITVSSGGNTVSAPAIEIVPGKALIADTLVMEPWAVLNTSDLPFYCRNGKGDLYIYRAAGNKIEHIKKDGSLETVLDLNGRSDEYGAYTIATMYSGGVDNSGENLWFSALTPDNSTDNARNDIYRLFHYNTVTGQLATVNRSLYYTTMGGRVITPFEGPIKDVKIFRTGSIYPDSTGNVYIRLSNYAICLLTASGQFSYLFHTLVSANNNSEIGWMPAIKGYTSTQLSTLLPGANGPGEGLISPDDKLMYNTQVPGGGGSSMQALTYIYLYDLAARSAVYTYKKVAFDGSSGKQYVAGPFNLLTGISYTAIGDGGIPTDQKDEMGFMPMPGARLLLFNYKHVYSLMDFRSEYARKYAEVKMADPSLRILRSYSQRGSDLGLNYDEEGMIYTISNGLTRILKSRIKQ